MSNSTTVEDLKKLARLGLDDASRELSKAQINLHQVGSTALALDIELALNMVQTCVESLRKEGF